MKLLMNAIFLVSKKRDAFFFLISVFYGCSIARIYTNLSRGCRFHGVPVFELYSRESLVLGDNVLINSRNQGYHISMYSRCKFVANKKDSKIIIGDNSRIHGTCIHARERVEIGNNVLIAANSNIFDNNGHIVGMSDPMQRIKTRDDAKPVYIGDGVWIGSNVTVLPGVKIGRGAVIASGSVVSSDVEDHVLAAGIPCKKIRDINGRL